MSNKKHKTERITSITENLDGNEMADDIYSDDFSAEAGELRLCRDKWRDKAYSMYWECEALKEENKRLRAALNSACEGLIYGPRRPTGEPR